MSNNAIDKARDRFTSRNKGNVSTVNAKFPPTVRLHNKEGKVGAYLVGLLDSHHTAKVNGNDQEVYSFKLIETNGVASKKEGTEYVDTEVKEGELISIFAPTRLARVLATVAAGAEVFIEYKGREPFVTKKGHKVNPHMFDVKAGGELLLTNSEAGDKADDFE